MRQIFPQLVFIVVLEVLARTNKTRERNKKDINRKGTKLNSVYLFMSLY